jgi:hypothetical protein
MYITNNLKARGEEMDMRTISMKLAIAALTLASTAALAQKTVTVQTGVTTVKLSSTFADALGTLGLTPGTVSPTELFDGTVDFPVVGGAIDLDSAAGNIIHSGGLTLTGGGTVVTLQSFIIDTTGTQPEITGLVSKNGKLVGRVPLFNLKLPAGFSLPIQPEYGFVQLSGVGVSLTSTAAGYLDDAFGTKAISGGLDIGTACVLIVPHHRHDWYF